MPLFIHYNLLYLFKNNIRNLSEANGVKIQITDKRFSLNTIQKNYILMVNLL